MSILFRGNTCRSRYRTHGFNRSSRQTPLIAVTETMTCSSQQGNSFVSSHAPTFRKVCLRSYKGHPDLRRATPDSTNILVFFAPHSRTLARSIFTSADPHRLLSDFERRYKRSMPLSSTTLSSCSWSSTLLSSLVLIDAYPLETPQGLTTVVTCPHRLLYLFRVVSLKRPFFALALASDKPHGLVAILGHQRALWSCLSWNPDVAGDSAASLKPIPGTMGSGRK